MLRYIAGIFDLRLIFHKDPENNIVGYLNIDYIGSIDKKKLTRAYIFIFAGKPISHFSKLQPIVSLLSYKAEYITLIKMAKKVVWYLYFLVELGYCKIENSILIWANNQELIKLSKDSEFHKCIKHIKIKWHKFAKW